MNTPPRLVTGSKALPGVEPDHGGIGRRSVPGELKVKSGTAKSHWGWPAPDPSPLHTTGH